MDCSHVDNGPILKNSAANVYAFLGIPAGVKDDSIFGRREGTRRAET